MLRVGIGSVVAVIAGLLSAWFLFGVVTFFLLCALFTLGFAASPATWRRSLVFYAGFFLLLVACLFAIHQTFAPTEPVSLLGGLPVPTAILVYIIWPAGILTGLFYGQTFFTTVLPPDRVQKFRETIADDDE